MYVPDAWPLSSTSLLTLALAMPTYRGLPDHHLLLLHAGTQVQPVFHASLSTLLAQAGPLCIITRRSGINPIPPTVKRPGLKRNKSKGEY